MQKIKAAAVKYKNGDTREIFTGKSHAVCREKIMGKYGFVYIPEHREGFVTADDEFVSRAEAATIAFSAGQIDHEVSSLQSWMIKID